MDTVLRARVVESPRGSRDSKIQLLGPKYYTYSLRLLEPSTIMFGKLDPHRITVEWQNGFLCGVRSNVGFRPTNAILSLIMAHGASNVEVDVRHKGPRFCSSRRWKPTEIEALYLFAKS